MHSDVNSCCLRLRLPWKNCALEVARDSGASSRWRWACFHRAGPRVAVTGGHSTELFMHLCPPMPPPLPALLHEAASGVWEYHYHQVPPIGPGVARCISAGHVRQGLTYKFVLIIRCRSLFILPCCLRQQEVTGHPRGQGRAGQAPRLQVASMRGPSKRGVNVPKLVPQGAPPHTRSMDLAYCHLYIICHIRCGWHATTTNQSGRSMRRPQPLKPKFQLKVL